MWFQRGDTEVKVHHLEYTEGGILDMDDLLVDLVEDRDKVSGGRCVFFLAGLHSGRCFCCSYPGFAHPVDI